MAKLRDPKRRTLILDSALRLFSDKGFYGVSVNELATASEIALGSMYTYFASKEQLANELYRHWKGAFGETLSRGLEGLRGRSAHKAIWYNLGVFMTENPLPFQYMEAQHHASYLDQESRDLECAINGYAVQFYREQLELGLSEEQSQLAVSAAFGAAVEVFKASRVGRLVLDTPTLARLELIAWHMASSV